MPRWIVISFLVLYVFTCLIVLGSLFGCGGGDPPPEREKDRYVRPVK